MDQQSIIIPNGSLMIVDRGWRRSWGNGDAAIATGNGRNRSAWTEERSSLDDVTITILKNPPEGAMYSSRIDSSMLGRQDHAILTSARKFAFVNSTGLSRNGDPDMQKFVRSHVMKGVNRDHTGVRVTRKVTNPSASGSALPTDKQKEMAKARTFTSPKLSPVFPGSSVSSYGALPFAMKPQFPKLLNYCMLEPDRTPGLVQITMLLIFNQISLQ